MKSTGGSVEGFEDDAEQSTQQPQNQSALEFGGGGGLGKEINPIATSHEGGIEIDLSIK
ncbi:hypothetical protein RchiOBHm_Chr1g0356171 [Rosa chinensis]|uniref:Uncharacterized protein n=1 Tax=Rosa chinensis TaxID=74649 RepID=A0A2P6SHN6_ROSCH|nr:hypothetical protein RchiOBHm_Chr1g0356171 [Rosa chinensis]